MMFNALLGLGVVAPLMMANAAGVAPRSSATPNCTVSAGLPTDAYYEGDRVEWDIAFVEETQPVWRYCDWFSNKENKEKYNFEFDTCTWDHDNVRPIAPINLPAAGSKDEDRQVAEAIVEVSLTWLVKDTGCKKEDYPGLH